MTREEMEMRKLVRESDVIDKTNGTELARAFNHLWNKYIEQEPCEDVPDINNGNIYKCSCGYGWDKSKVVRHYFCPNCGRTVDNSIKTDDIIDKYNAKPKNIEAQDIEMQATEFLAEARACAQE